MRTARLVRTVTMALILTLAGAAAAAQTATRNELAVFGGVSLMGASTSRLDFPGILGDVQPVIGLIYPPPFGISRKLGASGEFGVRYGRDVTNALTVATDFSVAPAHELTDRTRYGCPDGLACIAQPLIGGLFAPDFQFSQRVTAYHYGGGLRLNLRGGPLTPSVIAGVGGVTFSGAHFRDSSVSLRLGGSLTAAVRNLTTSVEVVDVIVPDHFVTNDAEHDVHVRLGFGVRW